MKCKRCRGAKTIITYDEKVLPIRTRCPVCKGSGKQPDFKFDKGEQQPL